MCNVSKRHRKRSTQSILGMSCKSESDIILHQRKLMEESRWGEKEVEINRMTYKKRINVTLV